MIREKDGKLYLSEDLPVRACYWCEITEVLRDPLDGQLFPPADVVIRVSPDRTAITPHYRGCKSS